MRTMFSRVTQKAAAMMNSTRLSQMNQDPSWLLPEMVVRSSSDSALLNSTLCVPRSAAAAQNHGDSYRGSGPAQLEAQRCMGRLMEIRHVPGHTCQTRELVHDGNCNVSAPHQRTQSS